MAFNLIRAFFLLWLCKYTMTLQHAALIIVFNEILLNTIQQSEVLTPEGIIGATGCNNANKGPEDLGRTNKINMAVSCSENSSIILGTITWPWFVHHYKVRAALHGSCSIEWIVPWQHCSCVTCKVNCNTMIEFSILTWAWGVSHSMYCIPIIT